MSKWLFLFLFTTAIFAQNDNNQFLPSPRKIGKELPAVEAEFRTARQMFNPWYAGPLLTGSGHTLPVGMTNVQACLYVADNFARFDDSKKPRSVPTTFHVNPVLNLQFGLLNWLDVNVGLQGFWNKQSAVSGGGYGDTALAFGISLLKEQPYSPAMKLGITESFPTGTYKNLNPNKLGLDSTGSGSFQTTFSLNLSKVIWQWWLLHPLSVRTSISYTIPTRVKVTRFNTYGGGYNTSGKVSPGHQFAALMGLELVIVKTFNIACDIKYLHTSRTTFSEDSGIDRNGHPATNSSPSNQQLSLAPALEYVPTTQLGFVAGVWFTVYGRNASDFISGVISSAYAF